MPGQRCPACGSYETQPMLDTFTCTNCGAQTRYDAPVLPPPAAEPAVELPSFPEPVVTPAGVEAG